MDTLKYLVQYFIIRVWSLLGQAVGVAYLIYYFKTGVFPCLMITIGCVIFEIACCYGFVVCSDMLEKKYSGVKFVDEE